MTSGKLASRIKLDSEKVEIWCSESVHSEARSNLQGHELLQEEFACVGDAYLADVLGALTDRTLELLLGEVGLADEAAHFADVHLVAVGDVEEALFEESCSAVRDHAVTLHLTKAKTTVSASALSRLPRQDLRGTPAP